jgi:hypothetical protein
MIGLFKEIFSDSQKFPCTSFQTKIKELLQAVACVLQYKNNSPLRGLLIQLFSASYQANPRQSYYNIMQGFIIGVCRRRNTKPIICIMCK